jgi:glycine dehydrogenase subunit 2
MGINKKTKVRDFHQAKWDEPIIFELHTEGERGIVIPEVEKEIEETVGDGVSKLPETMARKKAPALPEISQMRVLKHFIRLSQHCLGADLNVDLGQGTCTMKYSPKINEVLARLRCSLEEVLRLFLLWLPSSTLITNPGEMQISETR